jgi:Ca-activated chloride channel family protein
VLTDVQLDLGGAQTDLIYPRGIPDVFRGSQVTMIGRYSNAADLNSVQLKLTGKSGGATRTYTYANLRFPLRSDANEYLPRLWATRRVGWLMEQVRSNGEQKELRDEIVDLGTRYGIVTPYTSYLALENAVSVTDSGGQPIIRGAADTQGFSGLVMNAPGAAPAPKVRMSTGSVAVQQSKVAREQQEAARLKDDDTRTDAVRRVEGKTFYLINSVWTDSEFKAVLGLPETTLVFGSEEYFALLKQNPKLGNYFSLGERVVVVFEGRVYRVKAVTQ